MRGKAARDAFEYGMLCTLGALTVSSIGVFLYASATPDAVTGQKRNMKLELDDYSNPLIAFRGAYDEIRGGWTGPRRFASESGDGGAASKPQVPAPVATSASSSGGKEGK